MSKRTKELLRENNAWEKEKSFSGESALMTNIVVYIRSANLSEYEQELVRRDVMAMLAAGEREGRSAENVLGDDAQTFCDEVIAALPPRRRASVRSMRCAQGSWLLSCWRCVGWCSARLMQSSSSIGHIFRSSSAM